MITTSPLGPEESCTDSETLTRRSILEKVCLSLAALAVPSCGAKSDDRYPSQILLHDEIPLPSGTQITPLVQIDQSAPTIVSIALPKLEEILFREDGTQAVSFELVLEGEQYLPNLTSCLDVLQRYCKADAVWVPGYTRRVEQLLMDEGTQPRYRADFLAHALKKEFGESLKVRGADDQTLFDAWCVAEVLGNNPITMQKLQESRLNLLLTWFAESELQPGQLIVCLGQADDPISQAVATWNAGTAHPSVNFNLVRIDLSSIPPRSVK